MRFHAPRCLILCAVVLLAFTTPLATFAQPLSIKFKNQSGRPNDNVYIAFVNGALNATNAATNAPLAPFEFGNNNWYSLASLSSGINLSNFSGRVYVAYDTPWVSTHAGYEPSPVNPSDPNYLKRYDKLELTYNGAPADVADTTSIDYFSIPIGLNVYQGGTGGVKKGSLNAAPTQLTVSKVSPVTNPAGAAVVHNGANFVRVIGPSPYPPSPGLPASPYDNFDAYLTHVRDNYTTAGAFAKIKGSFLGIGAGGSPTTDAQTYDFTATIDASKNITLTGSGSVAGHHTLQFNYADLINPAGIYGANPSFSLDGGGVIHPTNDLYGWIIGDLLAGFNIGAIGSTVQVGGQPVGAMDSQQWFTLTDLFGALQPTTTFYNRWAAEMRAISDAYNFAYSDRFAHVTLPLNPATVDTLEIVILPDALGVPEPTSLSLACLAALGGGAYFWRKRKLPTR